MRVWVIFTATQTQKNATDNRWVCSDHAGPDTCCKPTDLCMQQEHVYSKAACVYK